MAAAIIMFQRIAFAQDVVTLVQEYYGTLQEFTVFQLRVCRVALLVGCAVEHLLPLGFKYTMETKWRDFLVLMCNYVFSFRFLRRFVSATRIVKSISEMTSFFASSANRKGPPSRLL